MHGKKLGALIALAWALSAPHAVAGGNTCNRPFPDVFTTVSPSVLRVVAIAVNPFRLANRVQPRLGSGFVIEPGDLVVTNSHVAYGAKTIIVQGTGSQPIAAELVGADPILDIAVLRLHSPVDQSGHVLKLGDSSALRVGQNVMAVGNPFGIGQTATVGVVSALDRVLPITTMSYLMPFIQTDAAINPGNSGGPLVNGCGEVVGVTSVMVKTAQSIGFAIPSNVVKSVVPELIAHGHVARPWYGIYGRMVDPLISAWLSMPPIQGFLVETVEPGSPAEKVGLKGGDVPVSIGAETFLLGGDIITNVNGVEINDMKTVRSVVTSLRIGEKLHIEYFRLGEGPRTADVVLPERPTLPSDLEFPSETSDR